MFNIRNRLLCLQSISYIKHLYMKHLHHVKEKIASRFLVEYF